MFKYKFSLLKEKLRMDLIKIINVDFYVDRKLKSMNINNITSYDLNNKELTEIMKQKLKIAENAYREQVAITEGEIKKDEIINMMYDSDFYKSLTDVQKNELNRVINNMVVKWYVSPIKRHPSTFRGIMFSRPETDRYYNYQEDIKEFEYYDHIIVSEYDISITLPKKNLELFKLKMDRGFGIEDHFASKLMKVYELSLFNESSSNLSSLKSEIPTNLSEFKKEIFNNFRDNEFIELRNTFLKILSSVNEMDEDDIFYELQ